MPERAALLISCTKRDAETIRIRARRERGSISGYMLHILLRAVRFEELLFSQLNRLGDLNNSESERSNPRNQNKDSLALLRGRGRAHTNCRNAPERDDQQICDVLSFTFLEC
jgi:hypothetical protein